MHPYGDSLLLHVFPTLLFGGTGTKLAALPSRYPVLPQVSRFLDAVICCPLHNYRDKSIETLTRHQKNSKLAAMAVWRPAQGSVLAKSNSYLLKHQRCEAGLKMNRFCG
eukprot:s83_g33.t1